ncbi:MAG: hypothetical protein S4CHLAM20_00270 [Chlamydiia bacterium]|nr:hypothetical protein [Chlamydiia bacterium]
MKDLSIADKMSDAWKAITVIAGIVLFPLTLVCIICYLIRNEMVRSLDERDIVAKIIQGTSPEGPQGPGDVDNDSASDVDSDDASDVDSDDISDVDKEIRKMVISSMSLGNGGALNIGLLNILKDKEEGKPVKDKEEGKPVDETGDAGIAGKLEESREIDEETRLEQEALRLKTVSLETFIEGLQSIFRQIDHAKTLVNSYDDSEVNRENYYFYNLFGERAFRLVQYQNATEANTLRKTRAKNAICRSFQQIELGLNLLVQVLDNLELNNPSDVRFYKDQEVQAHILNVFIAMSGMIKFMQPQETSPKFTYCKMSLQIEVAKLQKLLKEWKILKSNEKNAKETKEIDQCLQLVDQVLRVQSQFLDFEDNLVFNILTERASIVDENLDDRELVLLSADLFPSRFTDLSHERSFLTYYDQDVFKADGFNREGFNRLGRDRDGYNRAGFNYSGYDRDGYNRQGRDRYGYDRRGYDANGQTFYDANGYNPAGFDVYGFDRNDRDFEGYNRDGLDSRGYDRYYWKR